MIFKRKNTITQKSLERGKDIFFKFGGSIFGMMQAGEYQEYKKLNIPKNQEEKWSNLLFDRTVEDFKLETDICKKVFLIGRLIDFGRKETIVFSLITDFLNQGIDTFTTILLCESLKRFLKYVKRDSIRIQAEIVIKKKEKRNVKR